jgi:hypothetical protein
MRCTIDWMQATSSRPHVRRPGARWILVIPALCSVAAVFVVRFAPFGPPNDDYYGIAAQIIPVLLVALAIEGRSGSFWAARGARLYAAVLLLFLVIGELSALLAATGTLTHTLYDAQGNAVGESEGPVLLLITLTTAGLVGGFVGVLLVALVDPAWLGSDDVVVSEDRAVVPIQVAQVVGERSEESQTLRPSAAWLVAGMILGAVLFGARRRNA